MLLIETSLKDLYKSTIGNFKTTKRQNSIDTVRIENLTIIPFIGFKTLFLKGLARNENNKYDSIILFKNIKYLDNRSKKSTVIAASNGKSYIIENINLDNNVLVRCNCMDFYWRGNYADHLDKCLFGRKRSKYESKNILASVNPENNVMICKHLLKLTKVLSESKLLKSS